MDHSSKESSERIWQSDNRLVASSNPITKMKLDILRISDNPLSNFFISK